jgi:hypothetical protein
MHICYPLPDPICYPLAVYILRAQMRFEKGFLFKFELLYLTGLFSLGIFVRRSLCIISRTLFPFTGKGLVFFDYTFFEPWSGMLFGRLQPSIIQPLLLASTLVLENIPTLVLKHQASMCSNTSPTKHLLCR